MATRRRRFTAGLVALLLGVPLAAAGTVAPAWAAGTLGVSQQLSYNSTGGTSFEVPTGSGLILAINYSCGGDVCADATIETVIPAGLTVGAVNVVSGASSTVLGNTVRVTLPSTLAGGSAGQITISLGVPAWTTADGTTFTWTSIMRATGSGDATSNSVTVIGRAESVTRAEVVLSTGGTLDEPVGYTARVCVEPALNASAVAVAAGSVAVVTLPAGALFSSAQSGSVHSAGTITWTLGQLTGCADLRYVVYYESTSGNAAGDTKTTSVAWSGNFLGESGTIALGSGVHSYDIVAPTVNIGFNKWSFSGTAATTTAITWFLASSNTGNTTADEMTILDTIPEPMRVDSVTASMPTIGSVPGELWISSHYGPDGVPGGGDDDTLVKAADIPVNGSAGVAIYGAAWPSGAAALGTGDRVARILVKYFDVGPGQGGDTVNISATVMEESLDGTVTEVGDTIVNTADYSYHVVSGSVDQADDVTKTHTLTVVPQVTTITTSLGGGGTLAPGVSDVPASVGINAGPFPLRNPVVVLLLADTLSLDSWTPSSTTVLPEPTLTTVPNWNGTTSTLHRWTYPAGTVLAPGTGYSIAYDLELDDEAWGASWVRAYGSSASDPYGCTWNFFVSDPDTGDMDGDGNTTEVLCNWSFQVSPAPSTSADLTVQVDSAYSTGFETGTVYTAPGSADTYRLSMRNTGTLPLTNVVVVATLPRAGDTAILTTTSRNAATNTFPVQLTGAATPPTLGTAPIVSYTTEALPCLPELAVSASGCAAANWSTTLPSDPSTVTAVKVDYSGNTLNPYVTWAVDLPVTTPTTGAAEPDYAEINPNASVPANDEKAAGSAAFSALTQSSTTLTAESVPVTLRMPSIDGAVGVPPVVSDQVSTGVGTATQAATIPVPISGEVFLLDGSTEVTSLTVPGEGRYEIDPTTGVVTFEPELGFQGTASGVDFIVRNSFSESANGRYTPTVTPPLPPVAPDLTSTASAGVRTQSTTLPVPTSGSARLLDGGGLPVLRLTVAGEGDYELDPATGVVTFTPERSFSGVPTPISYRLTDAYGQIDDATYSAGSVPPPLVIGGLAITGADMRTGAALALLAVMVGFAMMLLRTDRVARGKWRTPAPGRVR